MNLGVGYTDPYTDTIHHRWLLLSLTLGSIIQDHLGRSMVSGDRRDADMWTDTSVKDHTEIQTDTSEMDYMG